MRLSLPSRSAQIQEVMRFLDSERNEGRSLEEIATDIVNGYHALLTKSQKPVSPPLRDGMLIKTATSTKVYRIQYVDSENIWITEEGSQYGWMDKPHSPSIPSWEEYRPKRRAEQPDGKVKLIEMTDEDIAEKWSNPEWKPGDRLSRHQREFQYEVILTAPGCVLLRSLKTGTLRADSNDSLKKYYKREGKVDSAW